MISRNQRWGDTIYLVEVIGGCKKLMVVPLPWANQGKTGQDRALLGFPGSFIRFPRLSSSRSKSVCQFTGILDQGRCGGFYVRFPNPLAMSSISSFILWCPRFHSILWFILSHLLPCHRHPGMCGREEEADEVYLNVWLDPPLLDTVSIPRVSIGKWKPMVPWFHALNSVKRSRTL